MKNKRVIVMGVGVAVLLLIPLVAMQFTKEVNWNLFDFIVAGIILFGTALLLDFVLKKVTKIHYRIGVCVFILALLLLIWAELAVGVFD